MKKLIAVLCAALMLFSMTACGTAGKADDGKYVIGICLGTACYVKGSGDLLEKTKQILGIDVGECTPDGKFSIEATRCIGACGLAPVLTVNDEVYGRLTVDDVEDILKKYE